MFWPVTNLARSEQRNTTTSATSSGVPTRASGVFVAMWSAMPSMRSSRSVSLVWIIPGDTAFARTVGAYSWAALAVSATTPLRRPVGRVAGRRTRPADGRGAHDAAAPAREQVGRRRLDAVDHASEVQPDDALPFVDGPVVDLGQVARARVVEHAAEPAERCRRVVDGS